MSFPVTLSRSVETPYSTSSNSQPATLHPLQYDDPASPSASIRQPSLASSSTAIQPSPLARHPGCVLCSLVASASSSLVQSDLSPSASPMPSPNLSSSFLSNPMGLSRTQYPQPYASGSTLPESAKATVSGREILFQDVDITVYPARGKERLCDGGGHIILVINRHLESVYDFVRPGPPAQPLGQCPTIILAYTPLGSCRRSTAISYT